MANGHGFMLGDAPALVCNKWYQATDYRYYQRLYNRGTIVVLPLTPRITIAFVDPEMYTVRSERNRRDIEWGEGGLHTTIVHLGQDSTQELNVLQAIYAEEGVVLYDDAQLEELESASVQIATARKTRPYVEVFAKHIATFDRRTGRGRSDSVFSGSVPNAPLEARVMGEWIRVSERWKHIGVAERDKSLPRISTTAKWEARQLDAIRAGVREEEELKGMHLNTSGDRTLKREKITRLGKHGLEIRPELTVESKWTGARKGSRERRRIKGAGRRK